MSVVAVFGPGGQLVDEEDQDMDAVSNHMAQNLSIADYIKLGTETTKNLLVGECR